MTRTYKLRRKPRTGLLAAGILAAGLVLGGTAAGFELAAPGPVAAAHAAPVPWPEPGQPGGGPAAAAAPAAPGVTAGTSATSAKSHTTAAAAARFALRHLHPHGLYIRRPHVLPWWLRRGN